MTAPAVAPYSVSAGRQWYLVFALLIINALAAIDRNLLNLLAPAIKADLQISDARMGLLLGASFALFYTLAAIPMGWLVDRKNRKWLLTASVAVWSAFTVSCGAAGNFAQLFVSRMGVGIGEASVQPASYSLVRDSLTPGRRGRGFSIVAMAAGLGGGLSFILGGALYHAAQVHGAVVLPFLGAVKPWQVVLAAVGLAGLPLTLLLMPIIEPKRPAAGKGGMTFREVAALFGRHWKIYLPLVAFFAASQLLTAPYVTWVGTLVSRNYGLAIPQVGKMMGPVLLIFPTLGYFAVGSAIDLLSRRGGGAQAAVRVGLVGTAIAGLFCVATPFAPNITVFAVLMAGMLMFVATPLPVIQSVMAGVTPSHASGKVIALLALGPHIVGQTITPWMVGLFSDRTFAAHGSRSLAFSISLTCVIGLTCSLAAIVWLMIGLRRWTDSEAAREFD